MIRATKFCEIVIHTLSGAQVRGRYHMDASLSSTIRPSDAIRDTASAYILLTHVAIEDAGQNASPDAVLVRTDGIAYIELSEKKWRTA